VSHKPPATHLSFLYKFYTSELHLLEDMSPESLYFLVFNSLKVLENLVR